MFLDRVICLAYLPIENEEYKSVFLLDDGGKLQGKWTAEGWRWGSRTLGPPMMLPELYRLMSYEAPDATS